MYKWKKMVRVKKIIYERFPASGPSEKRQGRLLFSFRGNRSIAGRPSGAAGLPFPRSAMKRYSVRM
jgi:hypothetical protein